MRILRNEEYLRYAAMTKGTRNADIYPPPEDLSASGGSDFFRDRQEKQLKEDVPAPMIPSLRLKTHM